MAKLIYAWRGSELDVAGWFGECVPASGAIQELGKSDVVGRGPYEGLRGENKWTDKKSYSLKLELLDKIRREAIQSGNHDWIFRVDFNGRPFIVISESHFRSMYE